MPILEAALLIKGAAVLLKAGPVIWTKIAAYAATHGVAATVTALAPAVVVVGGIKWTEERISAVVNLGKAIDSGDFTEIVKNAWTVKGILDVAGGFEGVAETKKILEQVISESGKNWSVNKEAAARCGTILASVYGAAHEASKNGSVTGSRREGASGISVGPEHERSLIDKVRRIIAEQLDVDINDIRMESSFVDDLGADSLGVVELVLAFEEEFEIDVPDEDVEKIRTVGDAVHYLDAVGAAA
jgi:acyl carrier protein